jgi:hypothetical protein
MALGSKTPVQLALPAMKLENVVGPTTDVPLLL